jgi:hypothetical protein
MIASLTSGAGGRCIVADDLDARRDGGSALHREVSPSGFPLRIRSRCTNATVAYALDVRRTLDEETAKARSRSRAGGDPPAFRRRAAG